MSSTTRSSIVVDASLFLAVILPSPYRRQAQNLWRTWLVEQRNLYAPHLWVAEVTSGLRQGVWNKLLTREEAARALERIQVLPITFVSDLTLASGALSWAETLGQKRAYDAFYVALAERLKAELWSADRRLVNRIRQQGETWAYWIGETGNKSDT